MLYVKFCFTGAQLTAAESSDLQSVLEELDVSTFFTKIRSTNIILYVHVHMFGSIIEKKMFLNIFILIIQVSFDNLPVTHFPSVL